MPSAGVGYSRSEDAFTAGHAAASDAVASAGAPPIIAIVYSTVLYNHRQLLAGIRSVLGDVPLVGCSTQGISRTGGVDEIERVVGVAVLSGPGITAHVAKVEGIASDPEGSGRKLAQQLPAEQEGCPLFVWYDPLTGTNVEALLNGLSSAGRKQVIGGGAGQLWGPIHRTFQFFGDEVCGDSIVGLHLDGVRILYDLTHGTEPLGLELTVTDAESNVLKRIDDQPALQVWAEQLGGGRENNVDDTAAWALGVQLPDGESAGYEGPITRAVFGFRSETQEIVLQAPIPMGTRVQLCHRTQAAVYDRAIEMAHRLRRRMEGRSPLLALSFECAARPRPFLGDEIAAAEVKTMQAILGTELPWLGYYAWGEIAPIGVRSYFHNYTFPLAVLVAP